MTSRLLRNRAATCRTWAAQLHASPTRSWPLHARPFQLLSTPQPTRTTQRCTAPSLAAPALRRSSGRAYKPETTAVIKNIENDVGKEQLLRVMAEMNLPRPWYLNYRFREDGAFSGFALANFESTQDVASVISAMNNLNLAGRKLLVEEYIDNENLKSAKGRAQAPQDDAGMLGGTSEDADEVIRNALAIKNTPFHRKALLQFLTDKNLPRPRTLNSLWSRRRQSGLAFATFDLPDDAASVMSALNGISVDGHKLSIEYIKKMLPQESRSMEQSKNDSGTLAPQVPPVRQNAPVPQAPQPKLSNKPRHENIYTIPNILTVSRIALTPVISYLILHDQHVWAVALFAYAGITDLVDGWIARKWNQQSVVGSVIDPMADKALMTVLTVTLAVKGMLPVWVATLILSRDVSLAVAAIYYRYASLPPPKTLARYWDFSLPSAEVRPTGISKINTTLQLMLIGVTTTLPVLPFATVAGVAVSELMTASQWLVAGTTLWSGLSYLYTHDAVKILGKISTKRKVRILHVGRVVIAASFAACFAIALGLERL